MATDSCLIGTGMQVTSSSDLLQWSPFELLIVGSLFSYKSLSLNCSHHQRARPVHSGGSGGGVLYTRADQPSTPTHPVGRHADRAPRLRVPCPRPLDGRQAMESADASQAVRGTVGHCDRTEVQLATVIGLIGYGLVL